MTLTPCDWALASIAAPEPESRLTSSSTLAPLVIICSAFWMSDLMPAASNAFFRNGRSTVSQRVEDLESGSRTPTLPSFLVLLPELAVLELELELLLLLPHPATTIAAAVAARGMSLAARCMRGPPPPGGLID